MKTIPFNNSWLDGFIWDDANWRFTPKNDVAAIVGLCRTIPGNIVEIGANAGVTTKNLALNLKDRIIFGVDYIGKQRTMLAEQSGENPETGIFSNVDGFQNAVCIHSRGGELRYDALAGVRIVFIDGDHSYAGVKADTENAITFLKCVGGGLLIWHDISENETWSAVFKYLTELEATTAIQVTRIEGSSLGFAFLPNKVRNRLELIRSMPANSIGCEVGVFEGGFSSQILETPVGVLHLVDCWRYQPTGYEIDSCNQDNQRQQALYERVKARFAGDIERGRVIVHRMMSLDAAESLYVDGLRIDWLFLDANHGYQPCLDDLRAWSKLVKPGGAIMGHDFTETNEMAIRLKFGVVKAVRQFCSETDWKLIATTDEDVPSFCLRK